MSYTIIERPDGQITIRTANDDNTQVSRRVIVPGSFVSGTWAATDMSAEASDVQAAATALWTSQIVTAWQTAHPWVSPVVTADQQRVIAILANPRRQALLAAALQTDDAGIISYINNNVTDLPSARTMLANIALILLAVVRS